LERLNQILKLAAQQKILGEEAAEAVDEEENSSEPA
jgi:hypothetical protein